MNYDPMLASMAGAVHDQMRRAADNTGETAAQVKALREEVETLRSRLQQSENRLADYINRQEEQRKADAVQAKVDARKQRRHEYLIAVFTFALTLLAEYICDNLQLFEIAVQWFVSLFH